MKNTITFQSGIKRVATRADNTLDITLNTQELPVEQAAQLLTLKNQHCAVAIAPHGEGIEPFDPLTVDAPAGKSPSQRLRSIIFLLWKASAEGYRDFDQYYVVKMNQICESLKSKLPS